MKTCLNCSFENPNDARYCARCRFTLDWSAGETEDPTQVLPPPAGPSLEVAIGPGEARSRAGARVGFDVRVANRGEQPVHVTLQVAGWAGPHAAVQPSSLELAAGATGNAGLTVAVPADAPPQAAPVEVCATTADSAAPMIARAMLTIEAPARQIERSNGRRGRPLALAVAAAAIAVAAILVVLLNGGGDDGLKGRSVASRACLHAGPDFAANPRIPDGDHCLGPLRGEEVTVECSTGNTLKLSGPGDFNGRFAGAGTIAVDGTPPPC